MPPLTLLGRPKWSTGRKVAMLTLRGYLVVSVILLIVKAIQLGGGYAGRRSARPAYVTGHRPSATFDEESPAVARRRVRRRSGPPTPSGSARSPPSSPAASTRSPS